MLKILICLLILTSCSSLPQKNARLDLLVNSEDICNRDNLLPGLIQGSLEWSNALGIEIDIKFGNWKKEKLNSHKYAIKFEPLPIGTIAYCNKVDNTIIFNTIYDNGELDFCRQVFIHEIGHAFGLKHSLDINSIMYSTTNTDNIYSHLSDIEIAIAKYNWLHNELNN